MLLQRMGQQEGIAIAADAAVELASRCSGSPGNAAALLKRIQRHCGLAIITIADLDGIYAELGFDQHYPKSLKLLDALNAMDGRDFEHWTAAYFRRQEYAVDLTEATEST